MKRLNGLPRMVRVASPGASGLAIGATFADSIADAARALGLETQTLWIRFRRHPDGAECSEGGEGLKLIPFPPLPPSRAYAKPVRGDLPVDPSKPETWSRKDRRRAEMFGGNPNGGKLRQWSPVNAVATVSNASKNSANS